MSMRRADARYKTLDLSKRTVNSTANSVLNSTSRQRAINVMLRLKATA